MMGLHLSIVHLPPACLARKEGGKRERKRMEYDPGDAPSRSVCQQDGMSELRGQQPAPNRRTDRALVKGNGGGERGKEREGRERNSLHLLCFSLYSHCLPSPCLIPRATISYANKPSPTSFHILAWLLYICSRSSTPQAAATSLLFRPRQPSMPHKKNNDSAAANTPERTRAHTHTFTILISTSLQPSYPSSYYF